MIFQAKAKETGEKLDLKRKPQGPRTEGETILSPQMETLTAVPYDITRDVK